jgi:hypothetical protein
MDLLGCLEWCRKENAHVKFTPELTVQISCNKITDKLRIGFIEDLSLVTAVNTAQEKIDEVIDDCCRRHGQHR